MNEKGFELSGFQWAIIIACAVIFIGVVLVQLNNFVQGNSIFAMVGSPIAVGFVVIMVAIVLVIVLQHMDLI